MHRSPPPSPPSCSPPSSPPFHGFGDETTFPQQLVIVTEGEGDEEQVVEVSKKYKTGRHSQRWEKDDFITRDNITETPRRPPSQSDFRASLPTKASSSKTLPPVVSGTSSRPKPYLLEKLESSFGFAKLPKTRRVLSVFLFYLEVEKLDLGRAAQETLHKVKEVWLHHFGMRVISGYDSDIKEETKKMIISDDNGRRKIISIWKTWKDLEKTSRRTDRAKKDSFIRKQEDFVVNVLDMPLNITRTDFENILKNDSGITDWKEDVKHLHNQLQKEQIGSCDTLDQKQRKRDNRKLAEKLRADAKIVTGPGMDEIEAADEDIDEGGDEETSDLDFPVIPEKKQQHKRDIMGHISATADRLGLSVRQRSLMAASVANSLGVDIDTTNINMYSAWDKARKERVKIAKQIKEDFMIPERLLVYWDGKISRVCVHISGANSECVKKLLGAPETRDGTGAAEAEVVEALLKEWGVKVWHGV